MGTFVTEQHMLYSFDGTTYTAVNGILADQTVNHTEQTGSEDSTISLDEQHSNVAFASDTIWKGKIIGPNGHELHVFQLEGSSFYILATTFDAPLVTTADYPGTAPTHSFLASSLDTSDHAHCFVAGTLIATPEGEVAVETLEIGDTVLTADGGTTAVKWIGRQCIQHRFMLNERLEPVCIRAGALGGGLPRRDLTVSADHGMILDGLVINASALVNHDTVDFVPSADLPAPFTYYHIETENHEVVLAEGAPAETFLDAAGRTVFDNYREYLDLYGAERIVPEMDRPRITSRRLLPPKIRARLGIVDEVPDFGLKSA